MTATDARPFSSMLRPSDVKNIAENHFRLDLGLGFALDLVLLHSFSVAFHSFGGKFLELNDGNKWPGSLFNPVVGQT